MSAKHAVLGLVIERPSYGYELAVRLEERCGAWGWHTTGVYNALTQLERDGYVRVRGPKASAPTGRGAPRVVYESTDEGVDYFRAWMYEATPPSPIRQELDLKIALSDAEFLPQLIDQTWAQEQRCMDELRVLTSKLPPGSARTQASWSQAAVILQRNAEIKMHQVRIEWLQEARRVMKAILERDLSQRRR
jgi:DNA-binding PadR family transcriptional regulator